MPRLPRLPRLLKPIKLAKASTGKPNRSISQVDGAVCAKREKIGLGRKRGSLFLLWFFIKKICFTFFFFLDQLSGLKVGIFY